MFLLERLLSSVLSRRKLLSRDYAGSVYYSVAKLMSHYYSVVKLMSQNINVCCSVNFDYSTEQEYVSSSYMAKLFYHTPLALFGYIVNEHNKDKQQFYSYVAHLEDYNTAMVMCSLYNMCSLLVPKKSNIVVSIMWYFKGQTHKLNKTAYSMVFYRTPFIDNMRGDKMGTCSICVRHTYDYIDEQWVLRFTYYSFYPHTSLHRLEGWNKYQFTRIVCNVSNDVDLAQKYSHTDLYFNTEYAAKKLPEEILHFVKAIYQRYIRAVYRKYYLDDYPISIYFVVNRTLRIGDFVFLDLLIGINWFYELSNKVRLEHLHHVAKAVEELVNILSKNTVSVQKSIIKHKTKNGILVAYVPFIVMFKAHELCNIIK